MRTPPPTWFILANAAIYQAGWLACVLAAAGQRPVWGLTAAAALLGLHLALTPEPRRDLRLAGLFAALGFAVDSTYGALGVFAFESALPVAWLCPPWLAAIWALFALTPHGCLHWLLDRPLLSAVVGAVGGPLAYWSGAGLGAITLHADRAYGLGLLAAGWAIVLPMLMALARRLGRGRAVAGRPSPVSA